MTDCGTFELPSCPCCGDASPDLTVCALPETTCEASGEALYRARAEYECPTCGFHMSAEGSSPESSAEAMTAATLAALDDVAAVSEDEDG